MEFFSSFPVLQTARLELKKMDSSDAEDLFNYNSDPYVTRYLSWDGFDSIRKAEEFISSWNAAFEEHRLIPWGIYLRNSGKLIGTIMLMPLRGTFDDQPLFPLTIGFDLNREYWNKGIMSEALQIVVAFGKDRVGSHRIQAEVFPENKASLTILKKHGFKEEGLLRQYLLHEVSKKFLDVVVLAMIKDNYDLY